MIDVASFIAKASEIYGYQHFVNDTGGSVCELDSRDAEKVLADNTVVLYIRADEDMEQELIRRASTAPKPMYYNEDFLKNQLEFYIEQESLRGDDELDPKKFSQWIFPKLVEHRRPLYQRLADKYGYTITANEAEQVSSEQDFLGLVELAIGRAA